MLNYQVKSTKNVQLWQILIISLLVTNLSGCAWLGFGPKVKPIEVVTKPMEKTPLDITLPDPLKVKPIKWIVVTPDNAEQIFKEMSDNGQTPVLFALTDGGYEQLALTIADLRTLLATHRAIIVKYKDYYETKPAEKK